MAAGDEIDRLFELPLAEFTAARNELAARLKKSGDAETAAEVRALAKPTAPVWAVNQAVRGDREGVRALLEAGKALRSAQASALGDPRAGQRLRDAQREERRAVQRLVGRARDALEAGARNASSDQLERIERTLSAAAVDPGAAKALEAGRLVRELEPGGFDALATLAPAKPRRAARGDEGAARREAEQRRAQKRDAQQAMRAAERRAREAEREADAAARSAERARAVAEQARAAADAAAAKLASL